MSKLIQTNKSFDEDISFFPNSKLLSKQNHQDLKRYRYISIFTILRACMWLDDIIDMVAFVSSCLTNYEVISRFTLYFQKSVWTVCHY